MGSFDSTIRASCQLTFAPHGHILTNINVWSPDSQWIVYDVRSDAAGSLFDGSRIERVNVRNGDVQVLYESKNGACCGVATWSPTEDKVAFILGPEHSSDGWTYAANRRHGVIVDAARPGIAVNLDARDLTPPFTAGALRGGTHVHVFSGDGQWISFTYQDYVLERFSDENPDHDVDLRNVGVSAPYGPVIVPKGHPRNRDGQFFSVLVTRTTANPTPGSDQICRAYEDAWIGQGGYVRSDGTRQLRALAFLGEVMTSDGQAISELFLVDVPHDIRIAGDGPLAGTEKRLPFPPKGTAQQRLTYTADRRFPGISGPRHWPRSSPDGSMIAFLMKDDDGVVQLWTISPNGGKPTQVTSNPWPIASAFSWSKDGRAIAHVMDGSVFVTNLQSGDSIRLAAPTDDAVAPRPQACVFSPDGRSIAYVCPQPIDGRLFNQVFVVDV